MAKLVGKLRRPEPNRKKYVIVSIVIAVVCIAASGGLYFAFKPKPDSPDDFGRRFRMPPDANLPNAEKQSPQEILGYMDSAAFKQLTAQQRMRYTLQSGEKVLDYQMDTYFSLPAEQKTAFLDNMIDKMQAMRSDFEQARQQMPQRRPPDADNSNRPREQSAQGGGQGGRRAPDPARMRARSERGTPEQRAKRQQFFADLRKRTEQRGITMPGPGGGPR